MTTTSRRMPCPGCSLATVQGYAAFQVGTQLPRFHRRMTGLPLSSDACGPGRSLPEPAGSGCHLLHWRLSPVDSPRSLCDDPMAAQPPSPGRPSPDSESAQPHASMMDGQSSKGEPPFSCEVVPDGESVLIRLFGELDIATAPEVMRPLLKSPSGASRSPWISGAC